jgi:hypothetical protein
VSVIIREVWKGDRSLGETFWLWGFIVVGLIVDLGGFFGSEALLDATGDLFWVVLHYFLYVPAAIWAWVGIWRSATNNPGGWAFVAKCVVGFVIAFEMFMLVEGTQQFSVVDRLGLNA